MPIYLNIVPQAQLDWAQLTTLIGETNSQHVTDVSLSLQLPKGQTLTQAQQRQAAALNISAFNVGIALGSAIGGQVTSQFGLAWTPLFGALMVGLSIVATMGLIRLARPARRLINKFNHL